MSICCAPKTPFAPEQVLKAVDRIEKLCSKQPTDAPSVQADTGFGLTIEMSADGNVLVVGAPFFAAEDAQGVEKPASGAVFVFKRKISFAACEKSKKSAEKYKLQQILVATDPKTGRNQVQTGAQFGFSLSVSGNASRIVVGAYNEPVDNFVNAGAVYVFDQKRKSLLYRAVQIILPSNPIDRPFFGFQVALSKDGRVLFVLDQNFQVVGQEPQVFFYEDCVFDFSSDCLHASTQYNGFVLKQSVNAERLVQGTDILATQVNLNGAKLELNQNGNTAIISAPGSTFTDSSTGNVMQAGLVFVVQRFADFKCPTGISKWSTTQVLHSKIPQEDARFGDSIAMTPDARFIAVEEPGRDKGDSPSLIVDVGLASVFERTCKTGSYQLIAELCPSGAGIREFVPGSGFIVVNSIAISEDGCTIAVGYELSTVSEATSAGVVVTYQRRCGSSDWEQTQVLSAFPSAENNQTFGTGLAISGDANTLAVGAFLQNSDDFVYTFSSRFVARH